MKNKILFFITLCLVFNNIPAQQSSKDSQNNSNQKSVRTDTVDQMKSAGELQREAIKKAGFLAGSWKGTEWLITPDGVKRNVESSDCAETKLNGTVILFQGVVKARFSESGDPVTVYEGMGLLSYNEVTQKYRLQHFGTDGSYADYECSLSGKTLLCEQLDKNNMITRITIMVNEAGCWIEKGERSQDANTWVQFFETKMDKISTGPDKSN